MASISIFQQARELETQLGKVFALHDESDWPRQLKDLVSTIKNQLIDARLDARDYEYAQTRAEQLHHAAEGKQRLEELQQNILKVSEYHLLSAVDVAHVSAGIQHIMMRMT